MTVLCSAWLKHEYGETLDEAFRVPFAARHREEVTAVHVNRPGQPLEGIDHRVNDVVPERRGVTVTERLRPGGLDPAIGSLRHSAPEDVVLPTRVHPDDGPHLVVVGELAHARPPDDVEDGQLRRSEDLHRAPGL